MARKIREESPYNIHHVTQRGAGRHLIFEDDCDRERFTALLEACLTESGCTLLAWCLMSNHFHLLVEGSLCQLATMMKRLCGGYARHFNVRHDRIGHLYQDRYHSTPIGDEAQLLQTVRYIHRNPAHVGADWKSYAWSSYREYLGRPGIASTEMVLECVGGVDAFRDLHDAEAPKEEAMRAGRLRVSTSDEEAIACARSIVTPHDPTKLGELSKVDHDACVHKLKAHGFSVRLIVRLTGLGRSIVSRA